MKLKMITALGLTLGLTSALSAKVYSPQHGVICDTKAGFCSDSSGISLAITEDVLGKKAAKKVSKMLNGSNFDSSAFTMSNGLSCDTNKKVCKKSKWDDKADAHWTKILFGSAAGHSAAPKDKHISLAKTDCKDYIAEKFELSKSTIHVSDGKHHGSTTSVNIQIKSKHPLVDEKGVCKITNGDVSYKASR